MAKILTFLINSNNLSIKNSFKLIDRISNFKINDNDLILSFDLVSLFTKIPVRKTKSVMIREEDYVGKRMMEMAVRGRRKRGRPRRR